LTTHAVLLDEKTGSFHPKPPLARVSAVVQADLPDLR
jgi:hypothetical protein